jgi:predicted O-methyltransferase YrrM
MGARGIASAVKWGAIGRYRHGRERLRHRTVYRRAVPDLADPRADATRAAVRALARRNLLPAVEQRRQRLHADPRPYPGFDLTVGEWVRRGSTPPPWCSFLRTLTRHLAPDAAIEVGTAAGMGTAYIASGMPPGGTLATIEGFDPAADLAEGTFEAVGADVELVRGWSHEVLPGLVDRLGPVGLVFLDSSHDEELTHQEWAVLRPALTDDAVVVWDDIDWSDGMRSVWADVRREASWVAQLGNKGVWAA